MLAHRRDSRMFIHLIVLGIGILMIYPVIWMLVSSFKPDALIFSDPGIWPKRVTLEHYNNGWYVVRDTTFGLFFRNSFIIAGITVIANVITCSMAAYAFARLGFPCAECFSRHADTVMLPAHVTLVPRYSIFHSLGWIDTYLFRCSCRNSWRRMPFLSCSLWCNLSAASPETSMKARRSTAAVRIRIFCRSSCRLQCRRCITTAIFTFIWTWDDFFSQMLYLSDVKKFTVPLGLRLFIDSQGQSSWGAVFAMSVLSLVPITLVFFFFQRYIVEGIATTGIKG